MKFNVIHDCNIVEYISANPFITVTDMFSIKMSSSTTSNKPEFYSDYNELWEKYSGFTETWKCLCRLLREYSETNDLVALFSQNEFSSDDEAEYQYIIPFRCEKNVSEILNALIAEEIIEPQSRINSITTQSCMVTIIDRYNNKNSYDTLFSRIDILLQTDFVRCVIDPRYHIVKVIYNNLTVNNLDCKKNTENWLRFVGIF